MAPDGRARWTPSELILAALSLLTFLYAWVYYPITQGHKGDFLALLSHRDQPTPWGDGRGGYGPIFVLYDRMLQPFHDLPAMRIMYAINLILLAATFMLLLRALLPAPRTRLETLVALFVWVSFYPLAQLVRQNNIEITELFFLALFLLDMTRRRPTRAGIALGLATSAKLIPIFVVPYLAWRRQWKAIAAALATLMVLVLVVAAIKGTGSTSALDDWRHTATAKWDNQWNNNQAFSGFFWRFFSVVTFETDLTASYPRVLHAGWAQIATLATSAAAMLATVVVFVRRQGIWPRPASDPAVEITELAIVLSVILLALPHSHTHYFGLIVWIYFIAVRVIMRRELPLSARTEWMFVLSFALAGLLMPLRIADPIVRRRLPVSLVEIWKLYSLPMFGIVLAVLALFAVHRAQIARTRSGTA